MIITDISISGATTDMKKIMAILDNGFAAQISKLIIVKEKKIHIFNTNKQARYDHECKFEKKEWIMKLQLVISRYIDENLS